jgi:hypothetical protein
MKKFTTYVLCLLLATLPACAAFSPAQREAGKAAIQDSYEAGELTARQRDDAIAAIESGNVDWSYWASIGGSILASVLLGVPISVGAVQKKRGPVATTQERQTRAAAKGA